MSTNNDKIAKAASALDALTPKPTTPKGAMAIVDALYDKISAAIEKGYTYDEISKLLAEADVKISASTLRQYYKQRSEGAKKRPRAKRKTAGEGNASGKTPAETLV